MSEWAFTATFYVLGFIGLAGLSTIWLRAWQFGRYRFRNLWAADYAGKVVAGLVVFGFVCTFWFWFDTVSDVFRCLTNPPCGPNRAAGWISLAFFGGTYLVLEILLLGTRRWPRGV